MKRISYLIFSMLLVNVAWSQELHVGSTAAITTLPITENKIINNVKLLDNFSVTEFPVNNQIYKRDKTTFKSTVAVSGNCNSSSGFSSIILKVFRNDDFFSSETQTLSYVNDNAIFNFTATITAELANYTFKLVSNTGDDLKEVENVASGDIYIVTGQSNSTYPSGTAPTANESLSSYIRTISDTGTYLVRNLSALGGIGYHFADKIVTNEKIPVLVLNEGNGGKKISFFQKDASEKDDITGLNNYETLLKRYTDAGLLHSDVTGIIWYQGEKDGTENTSLTNYLSLFHDLYTDWKKNYNPNKFYVFQVHKGCGITTTSAIPEAHRQIANNYTDVEIISTNGALQNSSDRCHYSETDGYEVLGTRLYKMLAFEVYKSISSSGGIYSPDITNAKYFEKQNKIFFDLLPATDIFDFESDAYIDFFLEDNSTVSITGGSVLGNRVTLNLSESIDNTEIFLGYLGKVEDTIPYIKNQNDIGMLNFKNVRVEIVNTQGNAGIGDAYGEVASATGKVWLDRNLGATQVATGSQDYLSYGDLYQWGRAADGHQVIGRDPASGTVTSVNENTQATTWIANASANAWDAKFITASGDWLSAPIDNLWTGTAAENNPCPSGFRIPTNAELNQERASWTAQSSVGAISSPLKLPVAGFRNRSTGTLYNVGSNGRYWSSTVSSANARSLDFSSGSANMYSDPRPSGYSVRCIKD